MFKALNHPIRLRALAILTGTIASPAEISKETGIDLSNVSYHMRVLEDFGLIEVCQEEGLRGSVARYYKAVRRPLISNCD